MIELGGNISLEGFEGVDPGKLIVIKKILGNYVKNISETVDNFESILISLKCDKDNIIDTKLICGKTEIITNSSDKNIFFALNNVLEELNKKL
ncbi:hypothetical protein HN865_03120 [Candidatus Woesearchaeota archaeon]|jgi:hypothetical protein|nr:hypothetical protein [Cryomorphaceae bacterium]MBT6995723.1 hypothetical protein [Candidatus Woesearchaeota archaeon]MBT7237823.1 hypothetical protein [Candidatus Woesearchaeota archaeon]